jgi:hypothetical protein
MFWLSLICFLFVSKTISVILKEKMFLSYHRYYSTNNVRPIATCTYSIFLDLMFTLPHFQTFIVFCLIWCLLCTTSWHRHFQQYFSYIVAVSFIGGGYRSTRRKPPTCRKSLTNVIAYCCIKYTSPWHGFELTTLVVIGTDCTGSCKSTRETDIVSATCSRDSNWDLWQTGEKMQDWWWCTKLIES